MVFKKTIQGRKFFVWLGVHIAIRTALETAQGIRYKQRMMGVNLDFPTYIYGDNMSVIHNTLKSESALKKKTNSVCYHYIQEVAAADEGKTGHIGTHANPAEYSNQTPIVWGEERLLPSW